MRVLLVEDDRDLSAALVHILERENYEVDAVFDGEEGLDYARSDIYDVIIFDVMLPKMSGFEAVEQVRAEGVATPVLMLTAKGAIPDKIEGLDSGADSYMTKPFAPAELLSRLRALTRRHVADRADEVCVDGLCLDAATRALRFGQESMQLCNKEYLLAEILMRNPSTVLTNRQIADAVWGIDEDVEDNSIEAYVSMLRKKLKFLGAGYKVARERGIGYRLMKE